MTMQARRHGRHHAGYKHGGAARMARGGAVWLLALAAVFTAGGLAQPSPSQAATASHVAYDTQFCRHFPEFGSSLRRAERTMREWAPLIRHPWADRELHADAVSLRDYLIPHPHAASTGGRYMDVYLACNPDA